MHQCPLSLSLERIKNPMVIVPCLLYRVLPFTFAPKIEVVLVGVNYTLGSPTFDFNDRHPKVWSQNDVIWPKQAALSSHLEFVPHPIVVWQRSTQVAVNECFTLFYFA
ncbi:MAG: hypothetical protein Kow00120_22660 [Anaerolineae bacterium]